MYLRSCSKWDKQLGDEVNKGSKYSLLMVLMKTVLRTQEGYLRGVRTDAHISMAADGVQIRLNEGKQPRRQHEKGGQVWLDGCIQRIISNQIGPALPRPNR